MKIAVLGAGNSGCAIGIDMASRGHEVTLIKTSKSINDENFEYLLTHHGKMTLEDPSENKKEASFSCVTRDISAVADNELIMIYVQSNYHKRVISLIAPFLHDGQMVMINCGYLSTAYLIPYIQGKDIIAIETESSFIDCRIKRPGKVKESFRNAVNPLGVYPCDRTAEAEERLSVLGFPFAYLENVVEAALHNPNLIVHTVGAVMSIPGIERKKNNYCMYHEVFTPSVWKILEALDNEKMDVLEKLGLKRLSYPEACKGRNNPDDPRTPKGIFYWYAGMRSRPNGPTTVDTRYITEDVPQGLVFLESLGKVLHVHTPITTALIEIASAALLTDFRKGGRTIHNFGRSAIMEIVNDCGVKLSHE